MCQTTRLFYVEHLHVEVQRGVRVGSHVTRAASSPYPSLDRNNQRSFSADLHQVTHAFVPTFDDLADADDETKRLFAIDRARPNLVPSSSVPV